jgi:hypothetical protein
LASKSNGVPGLGQVGKEVADDAAWDSTTSERLVEVTMEIAPEETIFGF